MNNMSDLLKKACEQHASDIFIIAGRPLSYKVHHRFVTFDDNKLMPNDTKTLITQIYNEAKRDIEPLLQTGDDDFSFSLPGISRFRVNCYLQRGSLAAAIRIISFDLPNPTRLHIPQEIIELAQLNKGMILVTGPAGSGKTTTLACMIDDLNRHFEKHIITLEDPIEYLHSHQKSIVSQREIGIDTKDYVSGLRASLRQIPDLILLGEMRDSNTISVAMTAAETGHTILATLHTLGASKTIDRIIDAFPPHQQHQIAIQLSMTLKAVVSQQLVPTIDGKLYPVYEIMKVTPAIRNLIRENKIAQIDAVIAQGSLEHMVSMDQSLLHLYQQGIINKSTCIHYASQPELMERRVN